MDILDFSQVLLSFLGEQLCWALHRDVWLCDLTQLVTYYSKVTLAGAVSLSINSLGSKSGHGMHCGSKGRIHLMSFLAPKWDQGDVYMRLHPYSQIFKCLLFSLPLCPPVPIHQSIASISLALQFGLLLTDVPLWGRGVPCSFIISPGWDG